MHFTKSTIALVASLMASEAYGLPAALTAKACGTTPAGGEPQQPLSRPNVDTAHACQEACTKDTSCKSFTFGLPPQSSVPDCKLFSVPGAQVPTQDSNAVVFDVACSNTPTDKPTQANPIGIMHKARGEPVPPPPPGTKPQETQPVVPKPNGPKARGEPVPPPPVNKPHENQPAIPKPNGPKARGEPVPPPPPGPKPNGPKARGEPVPPPPGAIGPQEPKPESPKPRGEPIPPPPVNKPQENKPVQPKPEGPKARGEAKMCGAAPAGPAGRAPQPIKSDASVATADACLALGKATKGCSAVQFSQPVEGGAPQCSLFDVSANVLPAHDGAKLDLVFDIGC